MDTSLGIAVIITPPGSALDLTLAISRDAVLLVAVLKSAIADADRNALSVRDPVAASGYRTQRDFLRKCLEDVTAEWAAAMTLKPVLRDLGGAPVAAMPEMIQ